MVPTKPIARRKTSLVGSSNSCLSTRRRRTTPSIVEPRTTTSTTRTISNSVMAPACTDGDFCARAKTQPLGVGPSIAHHDGAFGDQLAAALAVDGKRRDPAVDLTRQDGFRQQVAR